MSIDALDKQFRAVLDDYQNGASASSIATKFGVSVWSVITRLWQAGLRIRSPKEQNKVYLKASKTDKYSYRELVDGILLGDGQIDPKHVLHLEQSIARQGWIFQVRRQLGRVGASAKIIPIPPRVRMIEGRSVRSKEARHLYTPPYVENQDLRRRWYGQGVKKVPKDLVLTATVLTHWIAGDGTPHSCGGLTLCTNGFSKECVEFLSAALERIWTLSHPWATLLAKDSMW